MKIWDSVYIFFQKMGMKEDNAKENDTAKEIILSAGTAMGIGVHIYSGVDKAFDCRTQLKQDWFKIKKSLKNIPQIFFLNRWMEET